MDKRVVITGLGAITSLGETAAELWDGIKTKKCGIDEITLIDTTNFKTKLASEVKNYDYSKSFYGFSYSNYHFLRDKTFINLIIEIF